ncbi:MAG: SigB/SigF/SigG family RNA polymerase sigma factor [Solirubrobacterales bacterium]|nr:SigB/SigF/SigG family RNA polymerase sigma factor [Solirubrobacterales bacterium]
MPEHRTRPHAERALFAAWSERGDRCARARLIETHLPLARRLAARYRNPNEPFEDLVQVASLGLIQAVDRFDPGRGVAFSSFAIPTILGELRRHFRNTGWSAHVPRRAQELSLRVDRAANQLTGEHGRAPSVGQIAQYLELSREEVLHGLEAGVAHYASSLDAPATGENDHSNPEPLSELIGAEDDHFALIDALESLSGAMHRLPYTERRVLWLRLHRDLKQSEIAQRLDISQMQVSRLLRRANARLREHACLA